MLLISVLLRWFKVNLRFLISVLFESARWKNVKTDTLQLIGGVFASQTQYMGDQWVIFLPARLFLTKEYRLKTLQLWKYKYPRKYIKVAKLWS